jgi:hypothetical protein
MTPLGVNVLGSTLANTGFRINPSLATLISSTVLHDLVAAQTLSTDPATLTIGLATIPALGNPARHLSKFSAQATVEFTAYPDFMMAFMAASGFMEYSNPNILSVSNSLDFLNGTYSNMDDLISSDITGVNQATVAFGQDLLISGKAINLQTISTFGLPVNLLLTLYQYNAITEGLIVAFLAAGLTSTELDQIRATPDETTIYQQRQLYGAFSVVTGQDLKDVLIPLNCRTKNLTALTDLLDPYKLFPGCYQSLTVPIYNTGDGNSKIYYPIYEGTGVSSRLSAPEVLEQLGTPAAYNILPDDMAIAAGAFASAMGQIKNISSVPIEKFAQIVGNIETIKGLALTAGSTIPVNAALASSAHAAIALGSGPQGTYTMSDFFGCMSGLSYNWPSIQTLIQRIQSPALATIYANLLAAVTLDNNAVTSSYVSAANAEITGILARYPTEAAQLNALWAATSTQLVRETDARTLAGLDIMSGQTPMTHYAFVDAMTGYAKRTLPNMQAATIEAISDFATIGGQSMVAMMRETRNEARLATIGIASDATIPNTPAETPQLYYPNGTPVPASMTTLLANPTPGMVLGPPNTTTYINGVPADTGQADEPGSMAGNPYRSIIPLELQILTTSDTMLSSTLTPAEAINEVTRCNCDSWVL